MVTSPTRREYFPRYAGDFVFLGVFWIMGDTINPRVLDFVARFINISHLFSPLPGKEHWPEGRVTEEESSLSARLRLA
jgi:hypothetical protein